MTLTDQTVQIPAKRRKIPRAIQQAIGLLASGRAATQRQAAAMVSVSECHLSKMLKRQEARVLLAQETRARLDQAQLPAAATLIKLMEEGASEHARKDIAFGILKICGIGNDEGTRIDVNNVFVGAVLRDGPDVARIREHLLDLPGPGYVLNLSRNSEAAAAPADSETESQTVVPLRKGQ